MVGIKEPGTETQRKSGSPGPLAGLLMAIALAGGAFWAGQHYQPRPQASIAPVPSGPSPVVLPMPGSGKPIVVAPGMPIGENTIADIASEASKSVVTIDT